MADELAISLAFAYSKNGRIFNSEGLGFSGINRTVTGSDLVYNTQSIATTVTAIELGSIVTDSGTPGYAIFKNLDDTNFVSLRNGSGGANLVKLLPGDIAMFRLATSTPYAIADTAACILLYCIIEV